MARVGEKRSIDSAIEADVRREWPASSPTGFMQLISGRTSGDLHRAAHIQLCLTRARDSAGEPLRTQVRREPDGNGYMAPWIDTDKCTSCDECIHLSTRRSSSTTIRKKAMIKNPLRADLTRTSVRAAERCTAGVIHPGLPKDHSEKDIEKLIARAEKYNSMMNGLSDATFRRQDLCPRDSSARVQGAETRGLPISQFPFAPLLIVPFSQHISANRPCPGRWLKEPMSSRGQCIWQSPMAFCPWRSMHPPRA